MYCEVVILPPLLRPAIAQHGICCTRDALSVAFVKLLIQNTPRASFDAR